MLLFNSKLVNGKNLKEYTINNEYKYILLKNS